MRLENGYWWGEDTLNIFTSPYDTLGLSITLKSPFKNTFLRMFQRNSISSMCHRFFPFHTESRLKLWEWTHLILVFVINNVNDMKALQEHSTRRYSKRVEINVRLSLRNLIANIIHKSYDRVLLAKSDWKSGCQDQEWVNTKSVVHCLITPS